MKYDLVFEGGGAKGIVFVGAMDEFFKQGHTVGRVLGTSAGAITATLLAAGFTSADILTAVNEKLPDGSPRFASFMDISTGFSPQDIQNSLSYAIFRKIDLPFIPDRIEEKIDNKVFDALMKIATYRQIFSFIERGGLYAGDKFVDWITEKLDSGGRKLGKATFKEFHKKTGMDLSMVASDTVGQEMLVLNHRTAPDCPVRWGVRMSMSIPFVWQEVRWQTEWGKYDGEDITDHTIVDGGVLSNFPIELFISKDKEVTDVMGTKQGEAVLGLLIDEAMPVPGVKPTMDEDTKKTKAKLVKRTSGLLNTMLSARDKSVVETYANKVCHLPAEGYGTTEFDMSDQKINALIEAGRQTMKQHFKQGAKAAPRPKLRYFRKRIRGSSKGGRLAM